MWGFYLATGTYASVGRIVKLLPLANDVDSIDNPPPAARRNLPASNAVRDPQSAQHVEMVGEEASKEVTVVLNDVIEIGMVVDTVHMRKEIYRRHR